MTPRDAYHFYPSRGQKLPQVSKKARICMRLYSAFGLNQFERMVRDALNLPTDVEIQPGFRCLAGQLNFEGRSTLGDSLFIDYAPITIGRNVSISYNNQFITSTHDLKNFGHVIARPIVIEDDVWITSGVIILGGITIGRGSVIGAGSVVTKSIPPNSFAAGNPCTVISTIDDFTPYPTEKWR